MGIFSYTSDLPPQVRANLDVKLQELWLDAFNVALAATSNEAEAYNMAWYKVFQAAFPGQVDTSSLPQMTPTAQLSESHQGYWVDLGSIKLEEFGVLTWIQAMPLGKYEHPIYGKIHITPERVQQFAQNVKANVRGQDLDIDYDHKDYSGEASGWVRDAEARSNGLWIAVEWTRKAYDQIKSKAYRYFSPEFTDTWTHPKTGVKYSDVLFGGALTNRPFLKDIMPINLSEVFRANEGGSTVTPEQKKLLGLPEDATDEQVTEAITKLQTPEPEVTQQEEQEEQAEEIPTELKELSEKNPAIALLLSEREADRKRIATLETSNRLSEVTVQLTELKSDKRAVPPATIQSLKEVIVGLPKKQGDDIIKLFKEFVSTGFVELSELGGLNPQGDAGSDAAKRFNEKIESAMKADTSLSFASATEAVANNDPQLFAEYRKATYIKEGA